MSRICFINCNKKGCESKPFPIPAEEMGNITKCPVCDPDAHKVLKKAEAQKVRDFHNPPSSDAGLVQRLDGSGTIDPNQAEAPPIPIPAAPMAVPVVPMTEVKLNPQQKAAITRKKNEAAKRAAAKEAAK